MNIEEIGKDMEQNLEEHLEKQLERVNSWLSFAEAKNEMCIRDRLYKVRYVRMPDLLNEYAVAKSLNTQNKVKKTYARFDLLIIDEWLLRPLPESEAYDLLELIDACSRKGALILCTQYDVDDWYYRIDCDRAEDEGSAVAEGILDLSLIHI